MATVVLDAGHGGYDYGAVNPTTGRPEKDDNLRMTLAVGDILKGCGVNVVYTRSTDVFVPLQERSNISNRIRPDLFVSVHRNSSSNPAANGAETFVYTNPSQRALNAANNVQRNIAAAGVQSNRGVSRENFSVLRETAAPAILIELNFISNAQDNALYDQNFMAYANAIAQGIMTSLGVSCNQGGGTIPPTSGGDTTIRYIQETLNDVYGAGLNVDGITGPATRRALVRALQMQLNNDYGAGLSTDGIFGPATKAAVRTLRQGSRGNLVWILQAALYAKGYKTTPDGIYGPNTAQAVKNFQSANGLSADGLAGPNTFERLMR
jgi:N-acetylmuramoyl-L-alanine amidase